MTKKIAFYIFIILLLAGAVFAFTNPHSRWLIFNGVAASKLSHELLNQDDVNIPGWAEKLVIIKDVKNQQVSFGGLHPGITYLYNPENNSKYNIYSWQHLIGPWYIGKFKLNK